MSDFNKLKNYLNESSKASSVGTSTLNFFKQSFSKSTENLVSQQQRDDSTTDSWLSQADNDPWCPTLVINLTYKSLVKQKNN
jgi:hypothetical protein